MKRVNVADEEAVRCRDPEGNGVNPGGGNGGRLGPPGGGKISNRSAAEGGGNTLMERTERLGEEFGVTKETHHAESM